MNFVHRRTAARASFFTLKSDAPVSCPGPLSEALLIQASLDPDVHRIGYCETLEFENDEVRIEAPIFQRDDGNSLMLVDECFIQRDPDRHRVIAAAAAHSLGTVALDAADLMREPLATTARVVWRQRHVPVDLSMRLRMSHAFADEACLTVDDLCRKVSGPRDPIIQIMALCCEGLLRIDLSEGLNGGTIVRCAR